MNFIGIILQFIIIQLLFKQIDAVKYCLSLSPDGTSCLQCQVGYDLVSQSTGLSTPANANDIMICRAQCPQDLFRSTTSTNDNVFCNSLCSPSQNGNQSTRSCDELYKCPDSLEFGQLFHNGSVDNLLFYTSDMNIGVQQIVTSSSADDTILVWDSQTGQLIANFVGHTSNVLKILLINNSLDGITYLMSFSLGGELIIWNYQKATINYQAQIVNGQLQSQSQVDIVRTLIISFGFSGEFFVVNYQSHQSTKYVGHVNIVQQVLFFEDNYLISTSKDRQIFLWRIDSPNSPTQIIQMLVTNLFLIELPLSINSKDKQLFFFAFGGDNVGDNKQIKVSKLTNPNESAFVLNFITNLQTFTNHQNDIINLIIDQNILRMISYSQTEILIYDSISTQGNLVFSLLQSVNLSNLLPSSDTLISICQLFNMKFFISTNFGQLIFLTYSTNPSLPNEQIIKAIDNNYVSIEREIGITSQVFMNFSEKDQVLYAFSNQVIALSYQSKQINFIINNWPNPVISHTAAALRVVFSVKNSLYATTSQDGRGFVYDKLTLQIINILEYSKNKNKSRKDPIIQATSIIIVIDVNVCISYEDTAMVCYDPITGNINYQHQNNIEPFKRLEQDQSRNFLLAFSNNLAILYDLNLLTIHSTFSKNDQFFIYNFQGQDNLFYTSSSSGNVIKFNYPEMTIQVEINYSSYNTNNQIVTGYRLDNLNNMCILYFDQGLIIMLTPNLDLIKNLTYKSGLATCGINYPYTVICATETGGVVAWSIYTDYVFEMQLLDFPIVKGLFSFTYGLAFLQISYAAYGSAILIGDMQYLIASQNLDTSKHIIDFDIDDDRLSILTAMDTGDVSEYHFTPQPSIIVPWQLQNQAQYIQKIVIFQEAYKYIILSQAITIFDYLTQNIYKVKQLHNSIVTGVVIDKSRLTVISFNQDVSKNLFAWNYEADQSFELIGHTGAINGAQLLDDNGTLITYSRDGYIMTWNYLQQKIISKLNLHSMQPVLDLYIKIVQNGSTQRQLIISRGGNNQISIYDFSKGEVIAQILLNTSTAQLQTDDLYQRIFILYQNSIHVYSYINGLKITELLGFDGQVNGNVIIEDNYIIAYANLVIQCFNRQSLELLKSDKTTLNIFQASLLGDLIGIISDSVNDSIKVWNYKTGTMLQDMTNSYYPVPVNGIISDKEAKIFFVRNIKNQIFSFNPLAQGISKVENFMILPSFTAEIIIEILIDKQSNLFIAYNSNSIMQWKFYAYLGKKGQEKVLPSSSKINLAYHPIKDQIFYADFEKNLWMIEQNSQNYILQLKSTPLQCLVVGNILVIRENTTIKSYNLNFVEVTVIQMESYNLISDPSEINVIFIVDMAQEIIKVSVDQSTQTLTTNKKYQLTNGQPGSSLSRIQIALINVVNQHLLLTSQNGIIFVLNYSTDDKFIFTNHTNRIRKLVYDNTNQLLVSCSLDGAIGVYSYTQQLVQNIVTAPIGGQIEDFLLDLSYKRLIIWINLQTTIYIFDPTSMKITGQLLSPGDVNVRFSKSETFNKYAIYNLFQVNFYERTNLSFISSIRFPSDLQDIQDVQFLSITQVLIKSLSSIRIYSFSKSQASTLISQFIMGGSQIVSYSFDPITFQINLKGINYKTAFNYTFILFDQTQVSVSTQNQLDQKYCYTNIYNSKNYFTMKRSLELQEASFKQFNLDTTINTVKYNLIYSTDSLYTDPVSVFFPIDSSSQAYTNLVVYQIQDNSNNGNQPRILVNMYNAYTEYSLATLQLSKFMFYIQQESLNANPKPVTFHPNTKMFVFSDGLLHGDISKPIITQGFAFSNITSAVMETFLMSDGYFDGTYNTLSSRILIDQQSSSFTFEQKFTRLLQDQQYISSLFSVDTAKDVYIKSIKIDSCIFKNQNIFKFTNVDNIVIEDIEISNITFISTQDTIFSIFQIANSKSIKISNIKLLNIQTTDKFNLFSMYGNVATQIIGVQVDNIKNSNILSYTQYYSENDFEFKIKKDTLLIQDVEMNDINVDDMSQFDIEVDSVVFNDIKANAVVCQNCNGAVIQAQANSFMLQGSNFNKNVAFQGGSIYLQNCWQSCKVLDTIIEGNQATNGGGLFLQNSDFYLSDTQIINNNANIGGGVRYNGFIPKILQNDNWKSKNNQISNNIADIFGNNIASYPRSIGLTFGKSDTTVQKVQNLTSDSFSSSYGVSNFMSGDNFLLEVQLIDEEQNPVKINIDEFTQYPSIIQEELNAYQIQCYSDNDLIQLNSETLVSLNKYNENSYSFSFDKLVINSKPQNKNYFYLKTNTVQIPSKSNSSVFMQPVFSAFINVEFRKCLIGEIFIQKQAGQLEYCKKCTEGMYSLVDPKNGEDTSISCQICPKSAFKCQESEILLQNGYWRLNNETDLIVQCENAPQNCQGESEDSIQYCKRGYVGPLCESCDIQGKLWGKSYSRISQYQCQECSDMKSQYPLQVLAFSMIILYVIYGVKQSNQVSTKKIIGYYLRMLGLASVGTSDCQDYTSIFLKFLMHYLYISRIIKKYDFQLPFTLDFIQIQISSPIDSMKFVPDCYRSIFKQSLKPVYSRQIVSQMLPLIYFTCISLVYFTLIGLKKIKYSSNQVYNGLVFLFIFIQPDLISGIISASSCRTIGNGQYITDDISEQCLTHDHIKFLLYFCLPFFLIWGFLLPFILYISIYKVRKNLNYINARIRYGFLYHEYKLKAFYWEFLKITLKLLITIADNFLREEEILKSAISTLFILSYLLLSIKLSPYISHTFNNCDQYSHIVLIIILQMNILITISNHAWLDSLATILFYLFHYSMISYLIIQIFKSKFRMVFIFMNKKFPIIQAAFPQVFKWLNAKTVNQVIVYKNWRKVWRFIYQKHFTKKRNESAIYLRRDKQESISKAIDQNYVEQCLPKSNFFQSSPQVEILKQSNRDFESDIEILSTNNRHVKKDLDPLQKQDLTKLGNKNMLDRKVMSFDEEIMSNQDFFEAQQSQIGKDFALYNFQDTLVKQTNFQFKK